jgi:glycine/D-amino acid oxidase-like deaminating enzyme/nitrite reductase/ring-hydroxylating ferredoxin subunit
MTTERTDSIWYDIKLDKFESLKENVRTDVCVIGGGIAGLTAAYLLAKEGKKVILLEKGELFSGETGNTTAHLSNVFDDRFNKMEKLYGSDVTQQLVLSHGAAIDLIESLAVNSDFKRVDGYLFFEDAASLEEEYEAAIRAQIDVEKVDNPPIALTKTKALRFPNQARVHPLKYLRGLAREFSKMGTIYTHTKVLEITDGDTVTIAAEGYSITCKTAVVATNTPINKKFAIHMKQAPYRTYVIAAKGKIPDALYWDDLDPYHYVRTYGDYVIIGGEDHKTAQEENTEKQFGALERWAKARFSIGKVEYQWSGQVFEPADHMGFLGRSPGDKNVYIITGDSGQGTTHGTLGAMIIRDLICNKQNPWIELYDPSRKTITPDWIKENANAFAQYKDYLKSDDLKNIKKDSGMVVREGLRQIAVYCDEKGVLHRCSAVCTHLGGIVKWNDTEKAWECPLHGSRFDKEGNVLTGPAKKNLKKE